jgi:hypothetical protein
MPQLCNFLNARIRNMREFRAQHLAGQSLKIFPKNFFRKDFSPGKAYTPPEQSW